MSKRFIAMLAVTFIVFISSSIILLNKEIAEPIILPIGTQVLHKEEDNFIRFSYVTNSKEDIDVEFIRVGEMQFVPVFEDNDSDYFFFDIENEERDSIIQSYQYYDLHSVQFKVIEKQLSTLMDASNKNATAFFSNGVVQEFPLKMEVLTNLKEYLFVKVQTRENQYGELDTIFTITEDGTIEEVETAFPSAEIKLFKEDKQLTLPYNTQKGETLSIRTSPSYRIWGSIYQNAILHGRFATGEPFIEEIEQHLSELPPEKWVNDFVVEERDK